MSELKAYMYDDMIDGDADTNIEYYPKSEADKVIAEKDAEIVELKQEIERLKQEKFVIEQYKPIQPIKLLKPQIMENGCEYYLAGEVRMCIEQAARQIAESNSVYKELDTIIKHQKYKRCLAMALWCHNQREIYERDSYNWELEDDAVNSLRNKASIMRKWHKRWLELAEKFKEAK